MDIETIKKNPFLNISSARLLYTINSYLIRCTSNNYKLLTDYENNEQIKKFKIKLVKECESFLELDKEGYAKKFYKQVTKDFNIEQKFNFFLFGISDAELKNFDFTDIPIQIIGSFEWKNIKFKNVTIGNSINELLLIHPEFILDYLTGFKNSYEEFNLPNIKFNSWQENHTGKRRVSGSSITFFTKVYLELSRVCNANCSFCRNSSFDKCQYDLEKIKDTLVMIKDYVNAVVIGGGEPTLRLDDVKSLRNYFENSKIDWHLFTNGTNPSIIDDDYIMDNFKINLSRHAIDDKENMFIFNCNSSIMSSRDIERLNFRNGEVTLNATCFNGGLDSVKKYLSILILLRM